MSYDTLIVLSRSSLIVLDAMSSRLSDAMSKLSVGGPVPSRGNSMGKSPISPVANKRNSGLDTSTINAMFPDAAAAIAQKKAEYAQQTGNPAPSNRNSAAIAERSSLVAPSIASPESGKDSLNWRQGDSQSAMSRPKSSSEQQQQHQQPQPQQQPPPMGQFSQPPPSAGALRSPRNRPALDNIQNTTLTAPAVSTELPMLSPYNVGNQSWASMTNTPMVPNFNMQQTQSDMIANATAMKLAALSTVNNRIALDDVRKYRRPRSSEPQPQPNQPVLPAGLSNTGIPGINTIVVNEQGQILTPQQITALQQQQQQLAAAGRRSRPNSPGLAMQGGSLGQVGIGPAQNNGYLAAYDGSAAMLNPALIPQMGQMGPLGPAVHEGYLSDHSEIARGRSPRGRRGSSKPPEDPTDMRLLENIPDWLRSLRLHKYTDNLKDLKWQELVQLDDKGLEARGVNALGARNKMLKVRISIHLNCRLYADWLSRCLNKFEKHSGMAKCNTEGQERTSTIEFIPM